MKCILCKVCETALVALEKKLQAWFNSQIDATAYVEDEAGATALRDAIDLLRTDPAESFKRFLALAEQGSVYSMGTLGYLFELGRGTEVDLVEAEKWYRRAHESGSDYGLVCLGGLYERSGQREKARQVYQAGVERGFVLAFLPLAKLYAKSPHWPEKRAEVLSLLERASAAGDLAARRYLAHALAHGWFGLRRIRQGIRLTLKVSKEMADLVEADMEAMPSKKPARRGFFGRLAAQFSVLRAAGHSAS